jgi:hypothetical protein
MKRRGESGQVLPLIALCMASLMGFGGMAVDVGYWRYQQREQQSATDAAALGGAQQLIYSSCPNQTVANTGAQNDATDNGFVNGAKGVSVVANNPPSSGTFASSNCAVQVQITSSTVPTFFTRLFGKATMAVSTQAVAQVVADGNGCIYMLATGQNTNFNGANFQAPQCAININGSANFNGATVNAASIGEVDYSGSNNGGSFSSASPTKMLPVADPCPEIAGCAALASSPPSTSPCNGSYSGTGILGPGCYNNLNLHGASITLSGGTYVFAGSANFNGASITGSEVTIYIPAGATPPNFNKVTSMTLTPPTTGSFAGVTYYQVPSNSGGLNFNGGTTNLSGLIYAPSASINYNGSQGQYAVLVAAYANFNGSSGLDFGAPASGQSLLKTAVLSQ